jgi:hypothetical protein
MTTSASGLHTTPELQSNSRATLWRLSKYSPGWREPNDARKASGHRPRECQVFRHTRASTLGPPDIVQLAHPLSEGVEKMLVHVGGPSLDGPDPSELPRQLEAGGSGATLSTRHGGGLDRAAGLLDPPSAGSGGGRGREGTVVPRQAGSHDGMPDGYGGETLTPRPLPCSESRFLRRIREPEEPPSAGLSSSTLPGPVVPRSAGGHRARMPPGLAECAERSRRSRVLSWHPSPSEFRCEAARHPGGSAVPTSGKRPASRVSSPKHRPPCPVLCPAAGRVSPAGAAVERPGFCLHRGPEWPRPLDGLRA